MLEKLSREGETLDMIAWKEVCDDPRLRDLPFKIETNRLNQIVMRPPYNWHGGFQSEIAAILREKLKGGRAITECAIDTADGTKVADAAWISAGRLAPHRRAFSLPIAPEICVEIVSRSNTMEEMIGKMQLYFARGAEEVWLCDEEGRMTFYRHDDNGPVESKLCPEFPRKIDWD